MMDHTNDHEPVAALDVDDMRYLVEPRGKGYSLRMPTPETLIGTENPWTGKPFGREIKLGLNTRRHMEALRIRDVRVGQIRQLEAEALAAEGGVGVGRIIDLSPEAAEEWRQMRADASADERDGMDHVLTDQLEVAATEGRNREAEAFGARVFRGAMPLDDALEMYLTERMVGNAFGFEPLARTTALNVRSTVGHLKDFLGDQQPFLQDVTPERAFKFRTEYLPLQKELAAGTVAKHITLLRGMWKWAINDKRYLKSRAGKLMSNPWAIAPGGTKKKASARDDDAQRTIYTPDQVTKLLSGYPTWGSRQGDILRLLLVTGCRADEIGALALGSVKADGTGFSIVKGKTANASRYIPLVSKAQELLRHRIEIVTEMQADVDEAERRLFPEWSLKPSTGKANGLSQWFTRYRRQQLGSESDGALALHSLRHTWRTVARRAGAADDWVRELGGWDSRTEKEKRSAANVYDHGLERHQHHEVQQVIWDGLWERGYLEAF